MGKYRVDIAEPAENDLLDVILYISTRLSAPSTAMKMARAIEGALEGLADMPGSHPLVADGRLASMGYHEIRVKNYIAFYTIDEDEKTVVVERILHARRDWLRIL
jgi:plasmid stabilization system protein ParE